MTGYNEGDDGENGQYCRFQVYVKSLAACGVADPAPTPPGSADNALNALVNSGALVGSGGQFGYVVLGVVLTLAAQWLAVNWRSLAAWATGAGRSGNGLSFSPRRYTGVGEAATGAGASAASPLAGGYGSTKTQL